MNLKGGTLCQAKPKNILPLPSAPDATACADYDVWNSRMNRYVRRGSKGIALLDESSEFPRLHYVFDVSDTGVRRNSRAPDLWQYNDDLKQPVSEMLTATYGISGERVSQQLKTTAHIKQKRNTLTCQSAVENYPSLGKIDKVKKKSVSILTLHKECGIVVKHKISYSSSA